MPQHGANALNALLTGKGSPAAGAVLVSRAAPNAGSALYSPESSGSISDITSTGGTVAITNPTGPTTNLEAVGTPISALPNTYAPVITDIFAFESLAHTATN